MPSVYGRLPGQYLLDPRQGFAAGLIQKGTDTSPVQHWGQGLGRLGQALVGAMIQRDIMKDRAAATKAFQDAGKERIKEGYTLDYMEPEQPEIPFTSQRRAGQMVDGQPLSEDMAAEINAENRQAMQPSTMSQRLQMSGPPLSPANIPTEPITRKGTMAERLAALGELENNPYAQDTIQRYGDMQIMRDAMLEDEARRRGYQVEDRELGYKRQVGLAGAKMNFQKALAEWEMGNKISESALDRASKEKIAQMNHLGVTPANVKEWNFYKQLSPEQQDQFLLMKRANPYLNIGGQMVQPVPTQPGQIGGVIEKTVPPEQTPEMKGKQAEAAAIGKATGEVLGKAKADLPDATAKADYTLSVIDKMLAHPGLPGVVGVPSISGALRLPGTPEADFRALQKQLEGQVFMEAYQSLKGGGVITEIEGEKATLALARMQTAQTENAFKEGAREFQKIIRDGISRMEKQAGVERRPSIIQTPPQKTNQGWGIKRID